MSSKQAVKEYFNIAKYTEYGSANSFNLKFDDINVLIPETNPDTTGWIVKQLDKVSCLAIDGDHVLYTLSVVVL